MTSLEMILSTEPCATQLLPMGQVYGDAYLYNYFYVKATEEIPMDGLVKFDRESFEAKKFNGDFVEPKMMWEVGKALHPIPKDHYGLILLEGAPIYSKGGIVGAVQVVGPAPKGKA